MRTPKLSIPSTLKPTSSRTRAVSGMRKSLRTSGRIYSKKKY